MVNKILIALISFGFVFDDDFGRQETFFIDGNDMEFLKEGANINFFFLIS